MARFRPNEHSQRGLRVSDGRFSQLFQNYNVQVTYGCERGRIFLNVVVRFSISIRPYNLLRSIVCFRLSLSIISGIIEIFFGGNLHYDCRARIVPIIPIFPIFFQNSYIFLYFCKIPIFPLFWRKKLYITYISSRIMLKYIISSPTSTSHTWMKIEHHLNFLGKHVQRAMQ